MMIDNIIQMVGLLSFLFLVIFFAFGKASKNSKGRTEFSIANKWKLATNSFISLAILTLLLIFYPGILNVINSYAEKGQPVKTIAKVSKFALTFTLDPEESLKFIGSNDSLILKYKTHITEDKWKSTVVANEGQDSFTAYIDSVDNDDIYAVQLWNIPKNIFWANVQPVSVMHGNTKLIRKS